MWPGPDPPRQTVPLFMSTLDPASRGGHISSRPRIHRDPRKTLVRGLGTEIVTRTENWMNGKVPRLPQHPGPGPVDET